MAIRSDIQKCVFSFGHMDGQKFRAVGTGFFTVYENYRYIVTARHVANDFDDTPFYIRLNRIEGGSEAIHIDMLSPSIRDRFQWHVPDDDSVDLAIIPFNFDLRSMGYDVLCFIFEDHLFVTGSEQIAYGLGDTCHAIGLFSKAQGATRNVPIVHTGNLAMLASDERIMTEHWDRTPHKTMEVTAHLVEMASMPGFSGSPVIIKPRVLVLDCPIGEGQSEALDLSVYRFYMLGVWQGSWERNEPNSHGAERRPAGIGLVTPSEQLKLLLDKTEVKAGRDGFFK